MENESREKFMFNELIEKIKRWKILAEYFLDEDKRVFIVDINNTYFFADILVIGENKITFQPFKGNKSGEKVTKRWVELFKFEEYREVKE
jgi:hypothetical protein